MKAMGFTNVTTYKYFLAITCRIFFSENFIFLFQFARKRVNYLKILIRELSSKKKSSKIAERTTSISYSLSLLLLFLYSRLPHKVTLFAIAPGYNFQMIEIDLGNDGEPEVKNGKIVHLDCTKSSYCPGGF